jgi:hypothetical protein
LRRLSGQAFDFCAGVVRLLLGLVLVAGIGLGALVWRLDQGPIWIPELAGAIGTALESPDLPRVTIGNAGLAWTGWRRGQLSPVHFLVSEIRVLDDAGLVRAQMPRATVSLSVPWLLRGRLAPGAITLDGPSLTLVRQEDGSITSDLGIQVEGTEPGAGRFELGQLFRPLSGDDPVAALREVTLAGGRVVLIDRGLQRRLVFEGIDITLRRRDQVLTAELQATLQLEGASLPLRLTARTDPAARRVEAQLSLPALRPAALAAALPALQPLALLDTQAALQASLSLDESGRPVGGEARLTLGAGRARLDGQDLAFGGAELRLHGTPEAVVLDNAVLRLAPLSVEAGRQPPPVITLGGRATRQADGGWAGGVDVALDRLWLGDTAAYWPPAVAHNVRQWLVENVTAGTARDGKWRVEGRARADLSGAELTAASGSMAIDGATVHWLRPVPPVENASGSLTFGLKEVVVRARGRQSGTALDLREATARFYDLDTGKEQLQVDLRMAGPVADAVALIKHPRLKLFEKRPLEIRDPTGQMEATFFTAFPLLADLPVELITVRAQLRATALRIPDLVLGQTLERGTMEMTVDTNGLRASGTANLGDIPARLGVEMDFRQGPATQIVARERAELRMDARQLTRFGLDLGEMVTGPVGIEARTERRRNGQSTVAIKADLREAEMGIEAIAWGKPRGTPGTLDTTLRLNGDTLLSADNLRLQAGDSRASGRILFQPGTRLDRVEIAEAALGASRFAGEIRPPAEPRGPWRFNLNGPVADLAPILERETPPAAAGAPETDSLPVVVEARFDRVLLGEGRVLAGVSGRARSDSRGVLREARLTGAVPTAGHPGRFDIAVTPEGQGRSLQANAQNAGALLRAFDVLTSVQGGQLAVTARWSSNQPGAPLSGSARLDDFAIAGAPAVGKFLQALTVYGLFDAARGGGGLSFTRAEVPFTLQPHVLTLGETRAFSSSLGVTAKGRIDRVNQRIDLEGTIVPAYMINSLLGNIPLLGRLFAPERGGGLIAVGWRMRGRLDDPDVTVNPLSALTPGFLRGLFGGGG